MLTAEQLIALLNLKPLRFEGGFFKETYRLGESRATAIYYLLTPDTVSVLHTLPSDEIYHFYLGDPVEMLQLHPDGTGKKIIIGIDIEQGMSPQVVVPKDVWQGSILLPGGSFALLGATMTPGFLKKDYIEGDREVLLTRYPEYNKEIIARTTADRTK